MALPESERLKTKLHALQMRLAELDLERQRIRVHERQLESSLEDAELAALLGEGETGITRDLRPELDRVRHRLEGQEELIASVKDTQWRTRVHYLLQRQRERRQQPAGE